MKQAMIKSFMLAICVLAGSKTVAQNFKVEGLNYSILSDSCNTVKVIHSDDYSSLTSVIVPQTVNFDGQDYIVTSIGKDAFSYCLKLTSVTIPNSVDTIGDGAFSDCTRLMSAIIGSSVTEIGDVAFCCCKNLASIYSLSPTAPICGEDCFFRIPQSAIVYVPIGAGGSYQSEDGWSRVNIEEDEAATPVTVSNIAINSDYVDVYSLDGTRVRCGVKASEACDNLPSGMYIAGRKKVIVR